jgi:hypothetical protein
VSFADVEICGCAQVCESSCLHSPKTMLTFLFWAIGHSIVSPPPPHSHFATGLSFFFPSRSTFRDWTTTTTMMTSTSFGPFCTAEDTSTLYYCRTWCRWVASLISQQKRAKTAKTAKTTSTSFVVFLVIPPQSFHVAGFIRTFGALHEDEDGLNEYPAAPLVEATNKCAPLQCNEEPSKRRKVNKVSWPKAGPVQP